jgi:hypothetical protein
MYVLMDHELTDEQMDDARENLGVEEFVKLPQYLLDVWGNISPDWGSHDMMLRLQSVRGWLQAHVKNHDVLLIQGDCGATYYIVYWMAAKDVKSFAATSERIVLPDGSTRIKHVRFRRFIT